METKRRQLHPRKLLPPEEVIKKEQEKQRLIRLKNPVYRFIVTFFGEGF